MLNILNIGIPTLTVLVGILLNRDATNKLDSRINSLDSRINSLESSLRSEMTSLRAQVHSDLILLLERDNKLESRVAKLERV